MRTAMSALEPLLSIRPLAAPPLHGVVAPPTMPLPRPRICCASRSTVGRSSAGVAPALWITTVSVTASRIPIWWVIS